MFFSILLTCFGILIGVRIIEDRSFKELLKPEWKIKALTIYVGCSGFLSLLYLSETLINWILQTLLLFSLICVRLILRIYRTRSFEQQFLKYLDVVILQMHAGRSFRESLRHSLITQESFFVLRMNEILQIVVFSQQNQIHSHNFAMQIIEEFRVIDQSPHSSLSRVQNFRKKLMTIDSFRRRSGQILSQARTQCMVLCLLYLALALFVSRTIQLRDHWQLLSVSACLFLIGLVWALQIGRNMKWKL